MDGTTINGRHVLALTLDFLLCQMLTLQWPLAWLVASAAAVRCSTPPPQTLQEALLLNLENLSADPLLLLHRSLVEIESISGNEHGVVQYLQSYLSKHNFTVEEQNVASTGEQKSRCNILAYPGNKRNTRVLLSSHTDTVPQFRPYEIRGHEIWGRGSVDAKACVATQITALEQLLASGEVSAGDISLLFVVGEETGGDGMRRANDLGLTWETVIFGEPTELKLASGHKGILQFTVKAVGKAAHSGYPWLGESANSMLIHALAKLETLRLPWSDKYGNTTLNIGRIDGGVANNVVAETATAGIAVRLANGTAETTKQIILKAIKEVDQRLEVTFLSEGYGPVEIDADVEGSSFMLHSPFSICTTSLLALNHDRDRHLSPGVHCPPASTQPCPYSSLIFLVSFRKSHFHLNSSLLPAFAFRCHQTEEQPT